MGEYLLTRPVVRKRSLASKQRPSLLGNVASSQLSVRVGRSVSDAQMVELSTHPGASSIRNSRLIELQRRFGNAYVQRLVGRLSMRPQTKSEVEPDFEHAIQRVK